MLDSRNLNLGGSKKFRSRWVGPFVIVSCAGPLAYKLDLAGRLSKVHPVFHVSLLKPYLTGGDGTSPPQPILLEDGDLEY